MSLKIIKPSNFEVIPTLPVELWHHISTFLTLSSLYRVRACCHAWKILSNSALERALFVKDSIDNNLALSDQIRGSRGTLYCATCGVRLPPTTYDELSAICPFPYCRAVAYLPPAPPIVKYCDHATDIQAGALLFQLADEDDTFAEQVFYKVAVKDGPGHDFKIRKNKVSSLRIMRVSKRDPDAPVQLRVKAKVVSGCTKFGCEQQCCIWTPWSRPSVPFLPPTQAEVDMMNR
jgi:hypothetical protein